MGEIINGKQKSIKDLFDYSDNTDNSQVINNNIIKELSEEDSEHFIEIHEESEIMLMNSISKPLEGSNRVHFEDNDSIMIKEESIPDEREPYQENKKLEIIDYVIDESFGKEQTKNSFQSASSQLKQTVNKLQITERSNKSNFLKSPLNNGSSGLESALSNSKFDLSLLSNNLKSRKSLLVQKSYAIFEDAMRNTLINKYLIIIILSYIISVTCTSLFYYQVSIKLEEQAVNYENNIRLRQINNFYYHDLQRFYSKSMDIMLQTKLNYPLNL